MLRECVYTNHNTLLGLSLDFPSFERIVGGCLLHVTENRCLSERCSISSYISHKEVLQMLIFLSLLFLLLHTTTTKNASPNAAVHDVTSTTAKTNTVGANTSVSIMLSHFCY